MKETIKINFLIILFLGATLTLFSQNHPNLILTKKGVAEIKKNIGTVPMFDEVLAKVKAEVDTEIEIGVKVPIPKDMAGGYTHERHKQNFFILRKAGNLYQITGEKKYAEYIRQNLLAYAKIFPSLPKHPTDRSYATGKIFWQCLNDANWLVYVSQAYDCVYDYMSKKERDFVETDLFRPLAEWISTDNPKFFNRVHNHSTWANAGVGMIGLVMNDEELIQRALYGLKNDGLDNTMLDNDGGFIKVEGQNTAGFFAQLNYSFSPDGHFTEGPYYLRYAMTPFLLFAKSLANNRPDLKIYDYRNGILEKSIYSLLYETDAQGRFFPINDAQKGMSWNSREVVAAVDIAYLDFGNDPMLLSIAKMQGKVTLDVAGFRTAADLEKGMAKPFEHKSITYNDGAEGKHGGLGILRADNADGEEICLVAKYAAHGMGHGHFDKLSYSLYDEDGEVIQDYGSARWVNIDQKGGGRYLKENQSYAKQTIAHNALVINETSHYEGKVKEAEAHHPNQYFFDAKNPNVQAVSAKEFHAYADATMHRTFFLIKDENFRNPIIVDVMRVESENENQYDLPTWFHGHLLSTNFEYVAQTQQLTTLGNGHGYQHIWEEANGRSSGEGNQMTWFAPQGDGGGQVRGKIFTLTTSSDKNDELIFARAGANDPTFNLRHDPVFIQRRNGGNSVFASVIESHGVYDPVSEIPLSPFSIIESVKVVHNDHNYTVVSFSKKDKSTWTLTISNQNNSSDAMHELKVGKAIYKWKGVFDLKRN
jgi:hypothetical protein